MNPKQRRLQSHTCPPDLQSSVSVSQSQPRSRDSDDLHKHGQIGIRRALSLDESHFPESWWKQLASPTTHDDDDDEPQGGRRNSIRPPETDSESSTQSGTIRVSVETIKDAAHTGNGPGDSARLGMFAGGFEKSLLSGIKRVISRRQGSNPPMPPLQAKPLTCIDPVEISDTTLGECQLGEGRDKGLDLMESSQHKSETATSTADTLLNDTSSEVSQVSRHRDSDVVQDIDSIFVALITAKASEGDGAASFSDHAQVSSSNTGADIQALPESVPPSPVVDVYADVEAYIASTFRSTQAKSSTHHTRSGSSSSSYRDAVSEQGNNTTYLTTRIINRSSAESFSAQSESATVRRVSNAPSSPSLKYVTWNGPPKMRAGGRRAVQFSSELETTFHGKKENMMTLEERPLRSIIKHD